MEKFTNFLNERFGLDDLVDIGIQFSIEDDKIYLNYNDYKVPLSVSEEDEEFLFVDKELKVDGSAEYNNYYFSSEKNKLMEFKILKLKQAQHRESPFITKHKYSLNGDGFKIEISQMSLSMAISLFKSKEYVDFVKNRLIQKVENYIEKLKEYESRGRKVSYISPVKFNDLFIRRTLTAKITSEDKWPSSDKQLEINLKNLEKAFYILENNGEDCLNYYLKAWDFSNPIRLLKDENIEISFKIPSVSYDETLLRFYKNAIVAETVNHSFLSFYHVIEFYFLKCTEKNLQQQLKFFIDDPKFNSTQNNLEQLITTIKKYNYENDENKMLSCVLHEYIPAEALLSFVYSLGIKRGEGADIFGENIEKKGLEENNVIEVIGKTIKAIRNGIVHSSDKYNRADRFIPFSESEDIVKKYLPIVKFLAEKIIATTSH